LTCTSALAARGSPAVIAALMGPRRVSSVFDSISAEASVRVLKLTTEVSGFKHTFSRIDPSKTFPCPVISADILPSPSNYSREGVAGSAADKKSKNKIQISGEVVLPDTAAKPTDDKDTTPK
jgi:hypothetical protein